MDQETITTEAPGIDSGADANPGILTEADSASSFLERVDEKAAAGTLKKYKTSSNQER